MLAEGSVSKFIGSFMKEAVVQQRRAWIWVTIAATFGLSMVVISLIFTVGYFDFFNLSRTTIPTIPWDAIFYFGRRLFALSVLFYFTNWARRMALIHFNLANISKHRALVLQNLRALREATGNEQVKDAIVAAGAQTIFEHIPAGFLGKAETVSAQPVISRMVDVVRGRGRSE